MNSFINCMKTKYAQIGLTALFSLFISFGFSQNIQKATFSIAEISKSAVDFGGTPQIQANKARYYTMNIDELEQKLVGVKHREHDNSGFTAQISLPHPDGTFHLYNMKENSTMHPELGAKYSEIKTYDANGVEDASFVKLDITPKGFHAMIMRPGKSTIFIDPLFFGDRENYIVYEKQKLITDKVKNCSFNSDLESLINKNEATSGVIKSFGSCELRTYRLALSATVEYTTFQGGTQALALAAQVTTMNRVNGVYEKDMAITMVIIPNNDLIVFVSENDGFTNGSPGSMINENQTITDNLIGNSNYDIGHVFGTNSGGLAGLGVVCNNGSKARGVTGSSAPTGDSFDIDYVAHEMGHQFGCNHTFNNSCGGNRNNGTAYEPGSGTTIMAYAGICAPDIQNNSDDHFHGISLEEIGVEITSFGHTCETITALSNSAPVLISTNGNITVPANTPFALTATATDADGDVLTYNWEQMNNEISTQAPDANSTGGPNFRSNSSLTSPTRYFPNLVDLANGGPFTWEVLPSVTRTMNFRVTIRDNSAGAGGCNDHGDVTLATDAGSGPFVVTYPTVTGIVWAGATSETVTWDVANTDVAPVSCSTVDIFLSLDGGVTYPTQLADDVANDGSEPINVPNVASTTARIMVINSGGTFFDVSDNNFEITMATFDFTLATSPTLVNVCQPTDGVFNINVGEIGGFVDPVTLSVTGVPAGATSSFTTNPVTPVGTSDLVISNTGSTATGIYTLVITGTSSSGSKTNTVTLSIAGGTPSAVAQTSPLNGATGVGTPIDYSWSTAPETGISYDIDIALDAGFTSIVDQATGLTSAIFSSGISTPNTTYYWRVRSVTGCGVSPWSSNYSFTTDGCFSTIATDVPITISSSGTPTITSTITIAEAGTINDVNVLDLIGNHSWINDLVVTLESPSGTIVSLWDQICNNEDSFNLSLDDAAAPGALPCPPIGGGTYQPAGTLSSFNGESITGDWILSISDMANQDGGTLTGWTLELCTDLSCSNPDLPAISGETIICDGNSTTLTVSSGNLNDATDWEWYETSCGGNLVGTGTSVTVSPIVNTTYFVRGVGGCVIPGACTQVNVVVNPIYNETAIASICQGNTYVFGTQSLTVAGTYNETFTSQAGCDSTVALTLTVNPIYNETATASICQGDTYVFGPQSLTVAGTYNETFTSQAGCDSIVALTLTVNSVDVSVTDGGLTLTANFTGGTYQWINCDNEDSPINGEINQSFTATTITGNYAVIVTNGSCSDTSVCFIIDQSGIEENNINQVSIYPNPTSNLITIEWDGEINYIEITDTKGKVLTRVEEFSGQVHQLQVRDFANGIYFIHVGSDAGRTVHDIIKQ